MKLPHSNTASLFLIFLIYFLGASQSFSQVSGIVIDNFGQKVPNAKITFIDVDSLYQYTTKSDDNGLFSLDVPVLRSLNSNTLLAYDPYPNPAFNKSYIPFYLPEETDVVFEIFSITGKKLAFYQNTKVTPGFHQELIQLPESNISGAVAEVYLIRITAGKKSLYKKIVAVHDPSIYAVQQIPFNPPEAFSPVKYLITVSGSDFDTLVKENIDFSGERYISLNVLRKVPIPFMVTGNYIGYWNGNEYEPLFLKGINLGVSVPGTLPGELAATDQQYAQWIQKIHATGFNVIRVYTLHYPRFYDALREFNLDHPDNPLYLLQGIWLNEEVPAKNLFNLNDEFSTDIEESVDCLHGNRNISHRFGKAYGTYTSDVSPWTMGFIIGREVHPAEVALTNSANPGLSAFAGNSIGLPAGSAAEVFCAMHLDKLVTYEQETYSSSRPVSFSSWPTLDPLNHPTEDPVFTDEDVEQIDLENISTHKAPAGYFASFHAYPYYPDFISEDPGYRTFSDAQGPNSYLGYLTDLKNHYHSRPLIIAEFGVPSSWGNAHFAHSGMHHGDITEEQQGHYNVRMLHNIHDAGCGGGLVFAWIDEWFKLTWITQPFESEPFRRQLWHNVTSPEQNFGLLRFDEPLVNYTSFTGNYPTVLDNMAAAVTNEFLHIKMEINQELTANDTIRLALDTYFPEVGELLLPGGNELANRSEFFLEITENQATLYVTRAYNLFAIWFGSSPDDQLFHSIVSNGAPWDIVKWKNNRFEDAVQMIGELMPHSGTEFSSKREGILFDNKTITVRIPWSLLNFTDPSNHLVMDDKRNTIARETAVSQGISVMFHFQGQSYAPERFIWEKWNVARAYEEVDKVSLQIMQEGMKDPFPANY